MLWIEEFRAKMRPINEKFLRDTIADCADEHKETIEHRLEMLKLRDVKDGMRPKYIPEIAEF